jgi:hypothetical protein
LVTGSVLHQFTTIAAGLSLQYDFQQWHFAILGLVASPWRDINQPQVGATLSMRHPNWTIMVRRRSRGGTSRAPAQQLGTYGASSSSRGFLADADDRSRRRGTGDLRDANVSISRDQWQINERWKLANPFPADPRGAGLELSYAFSTGGSGTGHLSFVCVPPRPGWPMPNGIGEQVHPVFLRLSRTIGKQSQFDFYVAGLPTAA